MDTIAANPMHARRIVDYCNALLRATQLEQEVQAELDRREQNASNQSRDVQGAEQTVMPDAQEQHHETKSKLDAAITTAYDILQHGSQSRKKASTQRLVAIWNSVKSPQADVSTDPSDEQKTEVPVADPTPVARKKRKRKHPKITVGPDIQKMAQPTNKKPEYVRPRPNPRQWIGMWVLITGYNVKMGYRQLRRIAQMAYKEQKLPQHAFKASKSGSHVSVRSDYVEDFIQTYNLPTSNTLRRAEMLDCVHIAAEMGIDITERALATIRKSMQELYDSKTLPDGAMAYIKLRATSSEETLTINRQYLDRLIPVRDAKGKPVLSALQVKQKYHLDQNFSEIDNAMREFDMSSDTVVFINDEPYLRDDLDAAAEFVAKLDMLSDEFLAATIGRRR